MTTIDTGHVTSADGTTIGYRRAGAGNARSLVISHGSISTSEQWIPVLENLGADLDVIAYDRRGRGLSGDAEEYSLAAEVADVAAILGVAGPGAALLGHSYAGICTLEAVRTGVKVSAHIAFEPPLPVHGPTAGDQLQPYLDLVAAGELDAAMRHACDHFLRIPQEEKEGVAASPLWPGFVELTPTWGRELAEIDRSVEHLDAYASSDVRTLVLAGTASPGHLIADADFLSERLPNATRVDMPGLNHFAHIFDPAGFSGIVRTFLAAN